MRCPLCESSAHHVIGRLDLELAVAAMGARLPLTDLVEEPGPETVSLRQCQECELQYFSPVVLGSSRLYEHLAEAHYYEPLRWDQRVVLDGVARGDRVLDLGCGSGSFVGAAGDRGAVAVGVDFSATATAGSESAVRFVQARADLAEGGLDIVREQTGESDLVTAFQLVEHLRDPVGFLQQAATLLAPGGRIVVSVPNRKRFEIDSVQALDCPPHHQTRWAEEQLDLLGRRADLTVEQIVAQRTTHPVKLVSRLARRILRRHPADWPLPPAAGPWPPHHLLNGMSLVAKYRHR